jgi:hypothetical protein
LHFLQIFLAAQFNRQECSHEQIVFPVSAKLRSHSFSHRRHKRRIKSSAVFGTNTLAAYTTAANFFIALAEARFCRSSQTGIRRINLNIFCNPHLQKEIAMLS